MFNALLLYIDPSTGSMLFAVIIGVVSAVFFGIKGFMMKVKQNLGVDKKSLDNKNKLDYVIFSDHKRYWNVFEPICDEFEKRGVEVHYWTMSEDDPALKKPYNFVKTEFIGEGNKGFAKLNFMNAYICLSTTPGLDVYQWKRSKNCNLYVHCFHGVGLNNGGYRKFGVDYYDVLLQVSDHQCDHVKELEKKRNLPSKKIITVGQPYMDANEKKYDQMVHKKNEKTTVLLAPSWGESSILEKYKEKIIDALIKTGYNIIIRPHPQTVFAKKDFIDKLKNEYLDYKNIEWNFDNDNFDVLDRADIMISDFSGVMFDFLFIFNKPIIFTHFIKDYSIYDAADLDDKSYDYNLLKRMGEELYETDFKNLKEKIDSNISSDLYKKERGLLKDELWQNRGKAKGTIVECLIKELERVKND